MANNNSIFQFMQMVQGMRNPKQYFENMLNTNPQMQKDFERLRNSSNGASAEQMARQIAKQRGLSEEQLMQLYNSMNR